MTSELEIARPLLRLADTKLVLGNICSVAVFNGRSIADFATVLAQAGMSLGAARSIYLLLEEYGYDYHALERGRGSADIASMDALDEAPASWSDLMVTINLVESALLAAGGLLSEVADRRVVTQVRQMNKDGAFHQAYSLGWIKVLSVHEASDVAGALVRRLPKVLRWVAAHGPACSAAFEPALHRLASAVGGPLNGDRAAVPPQWDEQRLRGAALPAGLWEIVRLKDEELVA